MTLLDGERIIVTGAASGIGAASRDVWRRKAPASHCSTVTPTEWPSSRRSSTHLRSSSTWPTPTRSGAAVDEATEALGGLTSIFNNAGIGNLKPLHTYTEKEFDLLVDVNLKVDVERPARGGATSAGVGQAAAS